MTIPTYQEYYPYILKHADELRSADEYLEIIIDDMKLSDEDILIRNPSGEPKARNRLRWSLQYLTKALLLDRPIKGRYIITERGKKIRTEEGQDVTNKTLRQFEEFEEYVKPSARSNDLSKVEKIEELTPAESLESISSLIKGEVKVELRNKIFSLSPYFFEQLVIDLLKAMGYGSYKGTGVTSRSNDGGIDGIVFQDVLGLDIVYVQAKRYKIENNIGRPDIQSFIGALDTVQAAKGIFFTTSDFASTVPDFIKQSTKKIVTVNGDKLLDLLIEYKVGVEIVSSFNSYRMNEDYFSE